MTARRARKATAKKATATKKATVTTAPATRPKTKSAEPAEAVAELTFQNGAEL